jgi:putative proteasome-type protease
VFLRLLLIRPFLVQAIINKYMTYCLAIALDEGLVFTSDSRTNAGVDQVSTYSKMRTFGVDGARQFVLLTAGNLATTQSVAAQLERDIRERAPESLLTVCDMNEAAEYLGRISLSQQTKNTGGGVTYEASFILGGQISSRKPMIMMIYPQGNYITTSEDTPFLQIGESKYGKPILDRILTPKTSLESAAVCALVSMDSTMRSNITVGPPLELLIYRKDSLRLDERVRLTEDHSYLRELKKSWDSLIKQAFQQLPPIAWATARDPSADTRNATLS